MENLTSETLDLIRKLPSGIDIDTIIAQYLLHWRRMSDNEWKTMLGLNPYFHLFDQYNMPPREQFMWDPDGHIRWIPRFSRDYDTAFSLVDRLHGQYLFTLREHNHPLEKWEASFGKFSMIASDCRLAIARAAVCVIAHQSGLELKEHLIRATMAIDQLNRLVKETQ